VKIENQMAILRKYFTQQRSFALCGTHF